MKRRHLSSFVASAVLLFSFSGQAVVVDESAGDFGDTFADRELLPPGTIQAQGSTSFGDFCSPGDCSDWFAFTGLSAGQPFQLILESVFGDAGAVFQLYDGTGTPITAPIGVSLFDHTVVTGTVPSSGEIVVEQNPGQDSSSYAVTRFSSPAPGDVFLLALGAGVVHLDPVTGEAFSLLRLLNGATGLTSGASGDVVFGEFQETALHRLTGVSDTFDSPDPGLLTSELALAPDGTLLFSASPAGVEGIYRWRPGVGDPALLSPGQVDDLAVAPSGELFALGQGVLEQVDRLSGTRTAISSGSLISAPLSIAAESAGSVIVADDLSAIVRVDVATGSQSIVSAGDLTGRANAVAIASDGTILVGTKDSGSGGGIVRVDPVSGAQSPQALDLEVGTVIGLTSIRCTDGGGFCVAPPECSSDDECQDGTFCNGPETCDAASRCQAATLEACMAGELCDEELDACVECLLDTDCDDGSFCNGAETCDASGACQPGPDPCPASSQICDEAASTCIDLGQDFDISRTQATKRVRLGSGKEASLSVVILNLGDPADVAQLTITAVQNGNEVFGLTQLVQQQAMNGRSVVDVSFVPVEAGEIQWTASLLDADPDVDEATETTTVVP